MKTSKEKPATIEEVQKLGETFISAINDFLLKEKYDKQINEALRKRDKKVRKHLKDVYIKKIKKEREILDKKAVGNGVAIGSRMWGLAKAIEIFNEQYDKQNG